MNRTWHAIDVRVPVDRAELAQAVLWDEPLIGLEEDAEDPGHLMAYLDRVPDLDRVAGVLRETVDPSARVTTFAVEEEDWLRLWKRDWRPTPLGARLVLVPAWWDEPLDVDRFAVRIEPGRAFGTGTHESTALAWELTEVALAETPRGTRILDVGTGTGALALGAVGLRPDLRAFATEADPQAVTSLVHNLAINDARRFHPVLAREAVFRENAFSLVVANLTAAEHLVVDSLVRGAVAPGGRLVLSGFLRSQADAARDRWTDRGVVWVAEARRGEWVAMLLHAV